MEIDSNLINKAITQRVQKKKYHPPTKAQLLKATGITQHKLKIGDNDYAAKQLKVTRDDIRLHNSHCEGYEEGWTEAMKYVRKYFDI